MEIIKCDKCKKIIKPKGSNEKVKRVHLSITGSEIADWLFFDFCEECSRDLIKFVKNFLVK